MVEGLYVARVVSPAGKKALVYPAYTMTGYESKDMAYRHFLERLHRSCWKDNKFRPSGKIHFEPATKEAIAAAKKWAGIHELPADIALF